MKDSTRPGDVTELLQAMQEGQPGAEERLAAVVYKELHDLAAAAMRREPAGHTLQPTELVHEAYMRLVDQRGVVWKNRSHFYGIAVQAIRRLLIDYARRRQTAKRDHGIRVTLDESFEAAPVPALDLFALTEALDRLEAFEPRYARVVEARFFGGLNVEETAEALGTSPATVKRDWTFARAFLYRELGGSAA